jgi:putative endonuclease
MPGSARASTPLPGLDAELARAGGSLTLAGMKGGWVYFMSNRRNGVLYVGVTSSLSHRAWQHREGLIEGFTKRYGLKRLVYYERFEDIRDAIQREKTIKHWPRAWKVRLIHAMNPDWDDLYETLNQ